MRTVLLLGPLALLCAAAPTHAQHTDHNPYAEMAPREIAALSNDEVAGLLEGLGLSFALAAELNGVPGPLHVLELKDDLALTPEQEIAVIRIFHEMRRRTAELGAQVVELERTLDRRFRHRHIDGDVIRELTREIALLRAEIRAIHLEAHLEVDPILTDEQRESYPMLRGYHGEGGGHEGHGGHPEP